MLASCFPPSFLDTFSLSTSLGCKALCIVMSFLVLLSICLSSSLVHFKNGPMYLTRGTIQVFIPLIRFLLCSLFRRVFSFSWGIFYNVFFHLCLFDGVRSQYSQVFGFPGYFDFFFLIWLFYSICQLPFLYCFWSL